MLPEFSWYMSRSTQPCWQLPASIDIRRINCCAKTNFLTTKPSKSNHLTRMNLELTNKTALVSGSTKGIGFAIASQLAAEGARVIVNGRSENAVDSALQQIRQQVPNAKAEGFAGDLSTAKTVEDLLKRFPAVAIIFNHLPIFEAKPFEEITDADWRRYFEVNVLSGVRLSRAYISGMKQRNWARIIFISSDSALNTPMEMMHYGLSHTPTFPVSPEL